MSQRPEGVHLRLERLELRVGAWYRVTPTRLLGADGADGAGGASVSCAHAERLTDKASARDDGDRARG